MDRQFSPLVWAFFGLLFVADSLAAGPIQYRVSFPAPQTQMVDLAITVDDLSEDTVDFCLPVWRPGRYVVLDPAATVREVAAATASGQSLPVEKTDKSRWRVTTNGASAITLTYRVYANSLNDRTRHVDDTHAFLSPATVFMYMPERRAMPLTVTIELPRNHADWKIATGLEAVRGQPNVLEAAYYDVLVDSPLEIGAHQVIDFEAVGKPHQIVLWGNYPRDFDQAKLKKDFGKIINEAWEIFRALPYKRYVFIMHVGAGAGGGTEHLNSTVVQVSRAALEDDDAYKRFLGLVAHEFFHTWNVKQFRPEGLLPYDYQRENYTPLLWVCEGTTSYYTQLLLVRAGLKTPDDYFKTLGENIDSLRSRPSETVQSLQESSFDSWIQFSKSTPDDVNATVSFYSKGALVSLLLDLQMRAHAHNKADLDQVMRALFERFPLTGRGYNTEDLIAICNELTASDWSEFFDSYVSGAQPLPLEMALTTAGLELYFKPTKKKEKDDNKDQKSGDDDEPRQDDDTKNEADAAEAPPQIAYLGLNLSGNTVSSVLSDGPAYPAGLIAGDEIISIDGRRVAGGDLNKRLEQHKPGQVIAVVYSRREELRSINITLAGKPDGKWTIRRVKEPTDLQKDVYRTWLGQAWPEKNKVDNDE